MLNKKRQSLESDVSWLQALWDIGSRKSLVQIKNSLIKICNVIFFFNINLQVNVEQGSLLNYDIALVIDKL